MHSTKHTLELYNGLQEAYDYFNERLFNNSLPQCLITIHRKKGARGYYWAEVFENRKDKEQVTDEIALNPETFNGIDDKTILSVLVHEMVHLWQHHFGSPTRNAYHNREWANKMKSVGLQPTTDGTPEGKETGQKCTHLIVENGKFDQNARVFLDKFTVNWAAKRQDIRKAANGVRSKYTCPTCKNAVWGKDGMRIICGDCGEEMM